MNRLQVIRVLELGQPQPCIPFPCHAGCPPPSPPLPSPSSPSLPASACFSSRLVSIALFHRDRSSKLPRPMPARFHPVTLLCLIVAVVPICAAALPDLKFPHNGTAYCSALDVCSQAGKTRGTRDWFDCITLHALRDPPALSQLSLSDVDPNDPRPAASILMDCSGVGWGNRIRAFQARVPARSASPPPPLPFHVRAQVPASLALISGASIAYTDFHGHFAPGRDSPVALARLFAPPVGSSSWNHGVHSFSKYQVCCRSPRLPPT
jgi:hypothetical protein